VEAAWKTATNFCLRRVNWRGSRERARMLPKGNAKPLFRASHDRAAGLDAIAAKPYARSVCVIRQKLREWDAFCQHVALRRRKHLEH
jgi:hypothetical protein